MMTMMTNTTLQHKNRVGVCLTVADLGYAATLSASVLVGLDEGRGHVVECTDTLLVPFSFGAWHLPGHTARGTTHGRIGDAHMTFTVSDDDEGTTRVRTLDVEWPRFGAKASAAYAARVGCGLRAHLTLRERVGDDTIVVATPFGTGDHLWYLNQKINCQTAAGTATLGRHTHTFVPEHAVATLDWGRGLWPYASSWVWASASGTARCLSHNNNGNEEQKEQQKTVRFGLNFGHGFGNCATHTENCVFVDGRLSKLGRMAITFDRAHFDTAAWHFADEEGRVDMTMEPLYDRYAPTDVGVVAMVAHQVFGRYTGTVRTDTGATIAVTNVLGWAEFVANRW